MCSACGKCSTCSRSVVRVVAVAGVVAVVGAVAVVLCSEVIHGLCSGAKRLAASTAPSVRPY